MESSAASRPTSIGRVAKVGFAAWSQRLHLARYRRRRHPSHLDRSATPPSADPSGETNSVMVADVVVGRHDATPSRLA